MDKCFATSDHYGSVPVPIETADPSCDPSANFLYTKRVPSAHAGSYDPYCEVITSYGITSKDGHDIGWVRIDHDGSAFDPNTTVTKAVVLNDTTQDISVYRHIWPRMWNDPLASSNLHMENSLGKADKLRQEIAKICAKRSTR